jgi:hypothetical protein
MWYTNCMKSCSKCKIYKETTSFCADKRKSDGLQSQCKDCYNAYQRSQEFRAKARLAYSKNEKLKNRSKSGERKSYMRKYREENLERIKQAQSTKEYKTKHRLAEKKYRKKHAAKYKERDMKRYFEKLKRTPTWLSKSNKIELAWVYEIAEQKSVQTGILYEVDHIIPIKGKIVSGLHVPWNLQILTKTENNFKRHKFDGTYENTEWKKYAELLAVP